MTEVKPAGEIAVAETKPKNDYIQESHPEVKAEPAKAAPPTKTDAEPEEVDTDKDTDAGEGKKKRTGYQRKLDAADKEIARLNAELAARGNAGDKAPEKAADEAENLEGLGPEPDPDDPKYKDKTWKEFNKELIAWEIKRDKLIEANKTKKAEAQKASMTKVEKYKSQVTEARTVHKDFDEALSEYEGPSSPELHAAILDSDQGAEVAYYLATHADEAEKMRGMNTGDLYRFIGKIEAKLEAGKVKETPAVKTSKAPPPVQPVGKGSGSDDEPPDDPDEYIAWRRKRRANR